MRKNNSYGRGNNMTQLPSPPFLPQGGEGYLGNPASFPLLGGGDIEATVFMSFFLKIFHYNMASVGA